MFIAIVGTRFSGKTSIENYLVSLKGFISVRIIQSELDIHGFEEQFEVPSLFLLSMAACVNGHSIDSRITSFLPVRFADTP